MANTVTVTEESLVALQAATATLPETGGAGLLPAVEVMLLGIGLAVLSGLGLGRRTLRQRR